MPLIENESLLLRKISRLKLTGISHFAARSLGLKNGIRNKGELKRLEDLYRAFLFLKVRYPRTKLFVPKEVDLIWHAHILHTAQYVQDSNRIFGRYIHHKPSRSSNPNSMVLRTKTLVLMRKHFSRQMTG